tara:strand:- start:511 stop:618 length:108 start_codon:yes stop_codon:yes gene_type:complete
MEIEKKGRGVINAPAAFPSWLLYIAVLALPKVPKT